jgi:hypothetical protein
LLMKFSYSVLLACGRSWPGPTAVRREKHS